MSRLVDQPTAAPTRKTSAAALGAPVGTLVGMALAHLAGIAADSSRWLAFLAEAEVQGALVMIGATVGAFVFGYVAREWLPQGAVTPGLEDMADPLNERAAQ